MSDVKTIHLSSGSELRFKYCSFADFLALKRIILHYLGAKMDDTTMNRLASSGTAGLDNSLGQNFILDLLADREFEEISMRCASLCLLNGERINGNTFETVENRKDYFEVITHVVQENIYVFFSSMTFESLSLSPGKKQEKVLK
jgi:hypothetical protein